MSLFVFYRRLSPQIVLTFLLVFGAASVAGARNYYIDRFDDSLLDACTIAAADCGLRGAIIDANTLVGTDYIYLGAGTYELSRTTGTEEQALDLDITDGLTIIGLGPDSTTIDGNAIYRVFDIDASGKSVRFERIRVTGGVTLDLNPDSSGGGGIRVRNGAVTVESCEIDKNVATDARGGGIYSSTASTLTVVRSRITGNTGSEGSGISAIDLAMDSSTVDGNLGSYEGSVKVVTNAVIQNSTIGDNPASELCSTLGGPCGGLFAAGGSLVVVRNSTLAGNQGYEVVAAGAGLNGGPAVQLRNSVVIGTCGAAWAEADIESLGGNVESPGDTCSLDALDLKSVADAKLDGTLSWHGGPTPTFAPLPGSPVIDMVFADALCPAADQRGLPRPKDGDGAPASHCDPGAVEVQAPGDLFVENFESGLLLPWSSHVP